MKTLYISDLDKTLLCSNQKTSDYTNKTINSLVENGLLFSYATARSYYTIKKVTAGLNTQIPIISYNGAFITDSVTGEPLVSNYLEYAQALVDDLMHKGIYPIVYSYINNVEKFSYYKDKCSDEMKHFLSTRADDERNHPIDDAACLCDGTVFYISCMDKAEKLFPLYEKYKKAYHCVYSKDVYSGNQWLEIMSQNASKANALKQLKEYLGCDRIVAFGDGENDMDMFQIADEGYAVANAVDALKAIATQVIGSNDEDAVAKWLLKNAEI